jgi:hypothetical protein
VTFFVAVDVDPTIMNRDQEGKSEHVTVNSAFTLFYTKMPLAVARCHS